MVRKHKEKSASDKLTEFKVECRPLINVISLLSPDSSKHKASFSNQSVPMALKDCQLAYTGSAVSPNGLNLILLCCAIVYFNLAQLSAVLVNGHVGELRCISWVLRSSQTLPHFGIKSGVSKPSL